MTSPLRQPRTCGMIDDLQSALFHSRNSPVGKFMLTSGSPPATINVSCRACQTSSLPPRHGSTSSPHSPNFPPCPLLHLTPEATTRAHRPHRSLSPPRATCRLCSHATISMSNPLRARSKSRVGSSHHNRACTSLATRGPLPATARPSSAASIRARCHLRASPRAPRPRRHSRRSHQA